MTQRKLVLWIALQTALGLWFVWLLWQPLPSQAAAPGVGSNEQATNERNTKASRSKQQGEQTSAQRVQIENRAVDAKGVGAGFLLYGQITDSSGHPVKKALLSVRQEDVHRGAIESGPTGAYALAGLLQTEAQILVRADGFRYYRETITLDGARATLRHDLVLHASVVVKVIVRTPDGKALEPAMRAAELDMSVYLQVLATREAPDHLPMMSSSSLSRFGIGRFRRARWFGSQLIAGAQPEMLGLLDLDGELPVYVSLVLGNAILATKLVAPGQAQVEFRVPVDTVSSKLSSLHLQLVAAETGAPLGGVRVRARGSKITDAQGHVRIEGIVPGLVRLRIAARKHEGLDQAVRLEAGRRLDLGRVVLSKVRLAQAEVVDSNGKPTSASLFLDNLDSRTFPQPLQDTASIGTDAEGKVTLRLGPHRYAVHVHKGKEQVAHVLLDLRQSTPKVLRIELQRVFKVKLLKNFNRGKPYLLSVRTRSGLPVYGRFVYAGYDELLQLPAGEYRAEVHDGTRLVRSFSLTVGKKPMQIRIPR